MQINTLRKLIAQHKGKKVSFKDSTGEYLATATIDDSIKADDDGTIEFSKDNKTTVIDGSFVALVELIVETHGHI